MRSKLNIESLYPLFEGFVRPRARATHSFVFLIICCLVATTFAQTPPSVSFGPTVNYPVGNGAYGSPRNQMAFGTAFERGTWDGLVPSPAAFILDSEAGFKYVCAYNFPGID